MTRRDPYALWHDLDDLFVPLYGGGEPQPPPYPSRHRAVLLAFGRYSYEEDLRMAGFDVRRQQEARG